MAEIELRRRRALNSPRVKKGLPAYNIIHRKFGGLVNFCDATGFAVTTAHNWLRNGLIPSKWYEPGLSYQRYIMRCGFERDLNITADDFIEEMNPAE